MATTGQTVAPNASPRLAQRLAQPFLRFMELETSSALLLLAMTLLALVWANSPFYESYEEVWHHTELGLSLGGASLSLSLGHWVNDGLMAIFFFLVGMEIKRELVVGQLSTRAKAMLPVMGALGGMVAPALIYTAFHAGGPASHGWGIPMATDIAFAVAAMSVLGKRVPAGLKVFLLALAIADDLGAVLVIAIFYASDLHLLSLGFAALGLALVYGLNLAGVRTYAVYWAVGALVWFFTHDSGVHATVAGVALGFLTPLAVPADHEPSLVERGRQSLERLGDVLHLSHEEDQGGHHRHQIYRELEGVGRLSLSPLDYLTNQLERLVLFVIMPVFALANAGVHLEASTLSEPMAERVAYAVALGLVIGKPIGITVFSYVSVRIGLAALPSGVNWTGLIATGFLAGIGFTVALFVAALAFEEPVFTAGSKVGILAGSTLATFLGLFLLSRAFPREGTEPDA
jgi:NhaA family Na+:H+ antiporter